MNSAKIQLYERIIRRFEEGRNLSFLDPSMVADASDAIQWYNTRKRPPIPQLSVLKNGAVRSDGEARKVRIARWLGMGEGVASSPSKPAVDQATDWNDIMQQMQEQERRLARHQQEQERQHEWVRRQWQQQQQANQFSVWRTPILAGPATETTSTAATDWTYTTTVWGDSTAR